MALINKLKHIDTSDYRGFSLIEMIIVISIIVVITTVVLVRNQKFNDTLFLTNLTYEVGNIYRNAQIFGISVRGSTGGAPIDYGTGYGVYVSDYVGESATVSFVFFRDTNENNVYDEGIDTVIETYRYLRQDVVPVYCAELSNGGLGCFCGENECNGQGAGLEEIHVVYNRPNPSPIITACTNTSCTNYSRVAFYFFPFDSEGDGVERSVSVYTNGQISVSAGGL